MRPQFSPVGFMLPAIALTFSAIIGAILYAFRDEFQGIKFYSVAIGITASIGMVGLATFAYAVMNLRTKRNWHLVLCFGAISVFMSAGTVFAIIYIQDFLLGLGCSAFSMMFCYGAVATYDELPGFTNRYRQWECLACLNSGIGEVGDSCPSCGWPID